MLSFISSSFFEKSEKKENSHVILLFNSFKFQDASCEKNFLMLLAIGLISCKIEQKT